VESEDIFPTCSSENIPCGKKKRCQTAEQGAIQNNMPLAEAGQLQKVAQNNKIVTYIHITTWVSNLSITVSHIGYSYLIE
jgi:hypothetical protein